MTVSRCLCLDVCACRCSHSATAHPMYSYVLMSPQLVYACVCLYACSASDYVRTSLLYTHKCVNICTCMHAHEFLCSHTLVCVYIATWPNILPHGFGHYARGLYAHTHFCLVFTHMLQQCAGEEGGWAEECVCMRAYV